MKLLKLSEEHYIIADKLDIKVGDWITDKHSVWQWKDDSSLLGRLKVTHSTKPLEEDITYRGVVKKPVLDYWSIIQLTVSEVKELLGIVDVKKEAQIQWANVHRTGVLGYIEGYNQSLEDNKEKKYTEEDLREVVRLALEDAEASVIWSKEWYPKKLADRIIQSLQPKTEWEVEFVDDKLKLI